MVRFVFVFLALSVGFVGLATAQETPSIRLHGRAVIPAGTSLAPPVDGPAYFGVSGRFAGAGSARVDTLGAIAGAGGAAALPMEGQALQGISAILANPDGTLWALADNGFGNRANSADALLMVHRLRVDWESGAVERLETIFLSDPEGVAPFPIVSETSATRYLTGRDFDPESLAPRPGGGFFIGEEFGPFLLEVDAAGRLAALHPVISNGLEVRSPDHWAGGVANLGRSKGLEGMAQSPDGAFLYPMLEGPILDAAGAPERDGQGRVVLRIVQFDVAARAFTGREWLYPLADPDHAIGDFLLTDDFSGLVIERDARQGEAAEVKWLVEVSLEPDGGVVTRSEDRGASPWDLLRVRIVPSAELFRFPFVTIESIAPMRDGRYIIVNDNNYPFSAGRDPGRPDDTEFILVGLEP